MKIIVESGSTKAEWVLLDGTHQTKISTRGVNPAIDGPELISAIIESTPELVYRKDEVEEVHFYGAGCSSSVICRELSSHLITIFQKAVCRVYSDMVAAGRAVYGEVAGMVCILGTGSNVGFYDGRIVTQKSPSLGYVLGDEGSGSALGRKLIRDYFYGKLPSDMANLMNATLSSRDTVIQKVYNSPAPNRYLASFAPILKEFSAHPYVKELIKTEFTAFANGQLSAYMSADKKEIAAVGSIAHFFQDELNEVLLLHGWKLTDVIQRPLDKLLDFHSAVQKEV